MAEERGSLAGFLQLYPLFSSWHAARIWFLSDLFVGEAHRNRRIASELVRDAERFARDGGSASIMVEIPQGEPHLTRFYEGAGYQRDKAFDLYRRYLID